MLSRRAPLPAAKLEHYLDCPQAPVGHRDRDRSQAEGSPAWRCTAAVGEFFRVRLSGPIFSEWSTMHPRHGTGYRPQALHVETKCDGGIAQAHAPADVPLTVDIRIRIRPSAFEETAQSD